MNFFTHLFSIRLRADSHQTSRGTEHSSDSVSMNPVKVYQRYQRWRDREKKRCTVTISEPRTRIRGKVFYLRSGSSFIVFYGIPYAVPPIGRSRFAPPQRLPQNLYRQRPPLYRAYYRSDPCLQEVNRPNGEKYLGSEDCLYLNIFIPTKPEDNPELLPVIVHFHGGGFERGSGNLVDPAFLVCLEKCVVVTINFRLSYLGFLNMRTDNCRGNAGLKDQVMALRWIRDNVEAFGGDPHNVTIAGHSAGATSVNLLMISPLSKGLFHKAIVQAGGIYCFWGCGNHVNHQAGKLFVHEGRIMENEMRYAFVESFKSVPAEDLFKWSSKITDHVMKIEPKNLKVWVKPSVEYPHEDAFLPDTPENLMLVAEPVPTMAGITEQEGYMFYRANPPYDPVEWVKNEKLFSEFLKEYLHWCDESIRRFSPKLRAKYFPNKNMSDTNIRENFAYLMTDVYFRRFYDCFEFGNLSKSGPPPLYVYKFEYFFGDPILLPPKQNVEYNVQARASEHGDDMMYVLGVWKIAEAINRIPDPKKRQLTLESSARVTRNMRQLWASFCRNTVPTCLSEDVKWRPHTEENPCYLRIGRSLRLQNGRINERRWKELNIMCKLNTALASRPSTLKAREEVATLIPK